MNFNKLKSLVKASDTGIKTHATIEANKQAQQRQTVPSQPQRPTQSSVTPQQRQTVPSQPQRPTQSSVTPQQRQTVPSQPQRPIEDIYFPFNDAPILNLGVETQVVAQDKSQTVAQTVAQGSWVAQSIPQSVAQSLVDIDVEKFKEQIYQIQGVEERKKFVLSIGFGIASEKRGGKKSYLYGIKKIDGKKYRLYIGNSTKL
jgi:hypothetical protein